MTKWENRIIGEDEVAPDQLLANPLNWRVHPRHQQEALEGVLDEVGWVQRIIVNQRTGMVVDGHLRVALALRNEEPAVPVLYVDLNEREEALILATFDPVSALAESDGATLRALLEGVQTGSAAVQEMIANVASKAGLDADFDELDASPQMGDMEYRVIVHCEDEVDQIETLTKLEEMGLTCQALIS